MHHQFASVPDEQETLAPRPCYAAPPPLFEYVPEILDKDSHCVSSGPRRKDRSFSVTRLGGAATFQVDSVLASRVTVFLAWNSNAG